MQEKIIAIKRPTFLTVIDSFVLPAALFIVAIIISIYIPKELELKGISIICIICICGLATLILVLSLISDIYRIYSTKYIFTNTRVIAKHGLISTRISEVRVQDIRGITISKTFWGRILGYSSVNIGTAATAGIEMQISDVRGLDSILKRVSAERN